jgi:hypothetical protein
VPEAPPRSRVLIALTTEPSSLLSLLSDHARGCIELQPPPDTLILDLCEVSDADLLSRLPSSGYLRLPMDGPVEALELACAAIRQRGDPNDPQVVMVESPDQRPPDLGHLRALVRGGLMPAVVLERCRWSDRGGAWVPGRSETHYISASLRTSDGVALVGRMCLEHPDLPRRLPVLSLLADCWSTAPISVRRAALQALYLEVIAQGVEGPRSRAALTQASESARDH